MTSESSRDPDPHSLGRSGQGNRTVADWNNFPNGSQDSDISTLIPSYMDILTVSGQDWIDTYDFPVGKSDIPKRTVRKTKSLRENRTKLKSPPPPPLQHHEPSLPNNPDVKRKLSFTKPKIPSNGRLSLPVPRRSSSSSTIKQPLKSPVLPPLPIPPPPTQSTLSEYQGYARHSRHRSFTYSPPPPPRTSSLVDNSLPEVPPVPSVPAVPTIPPVPPVPSVSSVPPVPPLPKAHARSDSLKNRSESLKPRSDSLKLRSDSLKPRSDSVKSRSDSLKGRSDSLKNKVQQPPLPIAAVDHDKSNTIKLKNSNEHVNISPTQLTSDLTKELAEIEQDIKALEVERKRNSNFLPAPPSKPSGRKRGMTLPGKLATPPPIPSIPLPPMKVEPIHLTIPDNFRNPIKSPLLHQSKSITPTRSHKKTSSIEPDSVKKELRLHVKQRSSDHHHHHNIQDPGLGLGSGFTGEGASLTKRNTSLGLTPSQSTGHVKSHHQQLRRAASHRHQPEQQELPPSPIEGARAPKSVATALKYYSQYLSNYEKQIEIYDYKDIYFVGSHAPHKHGQDMSPELNYGYDDERGDYKIILQDHLGYRYEVVDLLGRGSFGQVVKCFDHKTAQMVAVKLIRNKKRFHAQAITEANILRKLVEWDPDDKYHTIKMTDHFYFRNHLCIVFECLSMNLYEFIKSNHFQGFSQSLIKRMTYQILQSLLLLFDHNVIHCDLKPENIMLKHPGRSLIKVIDFGSSCLETERVYTYIQSRFYRSPEVILGLSYNTAIDMWSLGCIIAELYTGIPLFPGENEQEQLGCIMEVIGLPDRHLVDTCSRRKLFFDSYGNPRLVTNSKGKKRVPGKRSLSQVLRSNDPVFMDFIQRCLTWDPSKRITPREALRHEWMINASGHNSITSPKHTLYSKSRKSHNGQGALSQGKPIMMQSKSSMR